MRIPVNCPRTVTQSPSHKTSDTENRSCRNPVECPLSTDVERARVGVVNKVASTVVGGTRGAI